MRNIKIGVVCLIALTLSQVHATNVFYHDKNAVSPNMKFKLEGKSPDNKDAPREKPFARNFVYTLTDQSNNKSLWERNQGESEGSCGALYVDNDGWVVIVTGQDELIFVNPSGKDIGKIDLLGKAFTKKERKSYVHETTAGPLWSGYSLWYFIKMEDHRLFVIRPWWNRCIVMDVEKGTLLSENDNISKACLQHEKDLVLLELKKGISTRKEWEREDCEANWPVLHAAYWAGKLAIADAVPLLLQLQDSPYSGACAIGSGEYTPSEGQVDPSNWEEMTMRRVVHLSLRRLGSPPGQYACTQFNVHYEDFQKESHYQILPLAYQRHSRADDIKKNMKPEEVLSIIGAPDFNDSDVWYYDMDAKEPYTLSIEWGKVGVKKIRKQRPPVWKSDQWDQEIVN